MAPPPDDCRLLSFLRLKVAGEPLPATAAAHFHDADIYAAEPAQLTTLFDPAPAKEGESGSWFFFTHVRPKSSSDSRKSRQVAGGVGTWHSERAPRRVLDDEGNCVGHNQYFSFKLKIGKNCSERTEWYMLEFSDGQEADHERVHGGEPQLVLCKIYKAHTHWRSGNGSVPRPSCSVTARKRKVVDEASAPPVKAKRRLLYSPAPASVASSQEDTSTLSNLICGKMGDTDILDCDVTMSKADGEAATSQLKIGDRFWPELEKIGNTLDCIAMMSKADSEAVTSQLREAATLQLKIGDRFWPELEKISNTLDCIAMMSKADSEAVTSQLSEAATSQLKIGNTPDFSRFWPEIETTTFDWGYTMTGGALPTPKNCSRTNVSAVGDLFCRQDAWSSAFHTSNDTTLPSAPVLPRPASMYGETNSLSWPMRMRAALYVAQTLECCSSKRRALYHDLHAYRVVFDVESFSAFSLWKIKIFQVFPCSVF